MKPCPALIISIIALVLAAGGTSYAAFKLPAGSVDSKALKKGAVTSSKVRDGSLRARDFGNLPRGPQGPKGDTGPQGPQGLQGPAGSSPKIVYAHLQNDGGVEQWSGITAGNVRHEGGLYCLHHLGFDVKHAQVTTDTGSTLDGYPQVSILKGEGGDFCDRASDQVEILIRRANQSTAEQEQDSSSLGVYVQLLG